MEECLVAIIIDDSVNNKRSNKTVKAVERKKQWDGRMQHIMERPWRHRPVLYVSALFLSHVFVHETRLV
jgi:hypothetical protein